MLSVLFVAYTVFSCTNFLVSPGASETGSSFVTYNADSDTLYGCLYYRPAGDHKPGEMIDIYDWDSGVYLGQIPQVNHTYNVVGNTNENQVTIGETTFTGISNLTSQPDAILDYGNLMWIALQRSKTAREAILTMGELTAKYGYYSEGESFSIGDPQEVWHMEMIGKGTYELGAVWVALRVPDGYIGGHANQARIRKFPWNDTDDNCMHSDDVISFAEKYGFYEGSHEDFSFTDVYNPPAFENVRWGEARVWDYFNHNKNMSQYLDYAQGYNLSNHMPLFIKPDRKVTLDGIRVWIRSHYNNTWFDMQQYWDWGNQPYNAPYRWRPLDWEYEGQLYLNTRAVATQQTGFTFIAEMRSYYPDPIGGLIWFGVDDTSTTVYSPFYSSITRVPWPYDERNGAIMEFTFDSIFWIMNMVATFTYPRWDQIFPDVKRKQSEIEERYIQEVTNTVDKKALELYNKESPASAIEYLTSYCEQTGNETHQTWTQFYGFLFTKFVDGDVKTSVKGQKFPNVDQPGYNDQWYGQIVKNSNNKFLVPPDPKKGKRERRSRWNGKTKGM